ncbi:hypothetical protein CLOM_g9564, partial [Closterium sp. NIES-68]
SWRTIPVGDIVQPVKNRASNPANNTIVQ